MPLERNRCFTGRETALTQLRQALNREGRAGVSQVQAIAGLGGVGKTQTALEYACRYYYDAPEAEQYQSVFWIRVDTEQAIQRGYQQIAEKLRLAQVEAQEPEVVVQAVKRWLAQHSGWLLVLDNADQPEVVEGYLPKQGQGHVLITSRVQDLQRLGVIRPLPLDAMEREEAIAFLLTRTGGQVSADPSLPVSLSEDLTAASILSEDPTPALPLVRRGSEVWSSEDPTPALPLSENLTTDSILSEDPTPALPLVRRGSQATSETDTPELAAVGELAEELGYLPLALEQAAAYVVTTGARFQDYLTSYRQRRLALLNQSAPVLGEYRDPIATTWDINFQAVEEASTAAADLLRLSTFLHPDSIPYDLIVAGVEFLGKPIQTALADREENPLAFVELLEPLRRYSLVRSEVEQTYSVHRLVQAVLQESLSGETERLWAERAVRMVTQAYPNADDFNNWPECERLLLHAQSGVTAIQQYRFDFFEAGLLLQRLGFYLEARGQYTVTENFYEKSISIYKKALGDEHPSVATSLNNLAGLYRSQGRYSEAEPLYREALEMRKRLLGDEHPDVAGSLWNLGALRYNQGQYEAAQALLLQAQPIYLKTLGSDHPNTQNLQSWINAVQAALTEATND